MREHLIGYVLGALEPSEQCEVESRLRHDPELQRELDLVRRGLEPLDGDSGHIHPPPGLAVRTCQYVSLRSSLCRQFTVTSGWRVQDLVVAAGIFLAASMLVFPAISQSRTNARLLACQNNLRALGEALFQYSQFNQGKFPEVPHQGRLAAAGIYAPRLLAEGFLSGPELVTCPASHLADESPLSIPLPSELDAADEVELATLHRRMGGSYGYSLGYVQAGVYHPLRNQGRAYFALMADAPSECTSGSPNHGMCGQNVLFEDGHVEFLTRCRLREFGDHIFQNNHGYVGAGIGPDDSVIATSDAAPIILPVSNTAH